MKKKEEDAFKINSQKAGVRISINSTMIGVLFFVLTFIMTNNYQQFNFFVIVQLILAIPLLFVSILAYSKIAYWKETRLWDTFGWITSNLGNDILLNAIGLMSALISKSLAIAYFSLILFLMLIYSILNIKLAPFMFKQKAYKFLFFFLVVFFGGILPLFFM